MATGGRTVAMAVCPGSFWGTVVSTGCPEATVRGVYAIVPLVLYPDSLVRASQQCNPTALQQNVARFETRWLLHQGRCGVDAPSIAPSVLFDGVTEL